MSLQVLKLSRFCFSELTIVVGARDIGENSELRLDPREPLRTKLAE